MHGSHLGVHEMHQMRGDHRAAAGRTRHLHVKVQAPGGRILTTQLYFPGESRNASDGIFRSELLMAVEASGGGQAATVNFVLDQA